MNKEQALRYLIQQFQEKAPAMSPEEREYYASLNKPQRDLDEAKIQEMTEHLMNNKPVLPQKVKEVPSEFMSKESDRQKANAVMDKYRSPQSLPQLPVNTQKDLDDSYNEFFGEESQQPVEQKPVRFQKLR